MPTNKQRRDAERRQLERQLQSRRAREERRRKQTLVISVAATVVLIAAIVVTVVVLNSGGSTKTPSAAGKSSSTSASPPARSSSSAPASKYTARQTSGACHYKTADPSTNPYLKNVGMPPDPKVTPTNDLVVTFKTNRGTIQTELYGKQAPCNVQALAYLIDKGWYNNTPCPRVANSGLFIVQCGSGGATTAGGPTFTVPDENTANADYAVGTIAMANTGAADSGSSQFFFMTKDDSTALAKSYSLVGKVTKGLPILQQVAAGGNSGSSAAGGGAPKLKLTFETVKVTKVIGGGKDPGKGPKPTLEPVS